MKIGKIIIIFLIYNIFTIICLNGQCSNCLNSNQAGLKIGENICMDLDYYFEIGTNKCELKPVLDQSCDIDSGCYGTYKCISGKCQALNYKQTDDQCSNNNECVSNICSNNKCSIVSGDASCAGKTCPYGKYCSSDSGKCEETIEHGLPIPNENDNPCSYGSSPLNGFCVQYYSLGDGELCSLNSPLDFCNITNSYFCNSNSACQFYIKSPTTDCFTDGCQELEFCSCLNNTCVLRDTEKTSCPFRTNSLTKCLETRNCSPLTNPVPESCVFQSCGYEYCRFLECQNTGACDPWSRTLCKNYKNPTQIDLPDSSNSSKLQSTSLQFIIYGIVLITFYIF